MGRKRKAPRETDPLSVIPIQYNKKDFEERNRTIIDFTTAIRFRNRDVNHKELSKEDVTQQYTLTILQEYATTKAQCFELLGQVESPAYNTYWAKLVGNKSTRQSLQQTDRDGFWISSRKPHPALVKKYPHHVILENKELGLVIVPDITLRSIDQISFKTTVQSIFHVNCEINSLYLHVREMWTAIVRLVYEFEDSASQDRKLQEMDISDGEVDDLLQNYRLSRQSPSQHGALVTPRNFEARLESKSDDRTGNKQKMNDKPEQERDQAGGKRDGEEEAHTYKGRNEESIDATRRIVSNKRLKRENARVGEWQELEKELNLAGEDIPAFPVSLQFANTDLPFRPKS